MDADAFKTVTRAIVDRLPGDPNDVHVGPLDDADAKTKDLVLFLYRVAINADLRNRPREVPPLASNDGGADMPAPIEGSLPFDLFYILSASPSDAGDDLDGLANLGRAIQSLCDQPILVGPPVRGETVRVSLDSVTTEELSRIWSLFPTVNYRTSVVFLATPVWIDPARARLTAPPVVSESYGVGPPAAA
jgi:hypothetical protein